MLQECRKKSYHVLERTLQYSLCKAGAEPCPCRAGPCRLRGAVLSNVSASAFPACGDLECGLGTVSLAHTVSAAQTVKELTGSLVCLFSWSCEEQNMQTSAARVFQVRKELSCVLLAGRSACWSNGLLQTNWQFLRQTNKKIGIKCYLAYLLYTKGNNCIEYIVFSGFNQQYLPTA